MTEEAGLLAVRAKYGPDIENRMRAWPKLAEQFAREHYGDPHTIAREVRLAERALSRACSDPVFALDQAESIRRSGVLGGGAA